MRYAIYYCPQVHSEWWSRGSRWLGRCAVRREQMEVPVTPGVSNIAFLQLTHDPRRYGWHATLKAPFVLAPGTTEGMLREAVRLLARRTKAFDLPTLEVQQIRNFLALVPQTDSSELSAIAAGCVTELHRYAAPLSVSELVRRRRSPLSPQEETLLEQWGYPYVLDAFRFHCSLTGDLGGLTVDERKSVIEAATNWFAGLPPPRFDNLSLVLEPAPGADFVLLEQAGLQE